MLSQQLPLLQSFKKMRLRRRIAFLCMICTLFICLVAVPGLAQDSSDFNRTFTHHTVNISGIKIHYVIGGQGQPVVLLHGWPTTWYEWRRIMPTLAEHYTVIAPDTRGLGDSSRPLAAYDKRTLAEDIYQLTQQLGFDRIKLVGHDLGAQIAYAYANEHPEQVERVAILDVPIPGLTGWDEVQNWHFPFHQARDIPEALVEGKERMYISWFYTDFAYNPSAFTEADIDEYYRTYSLPGAMRAGFEYYRAFPDDIKQNEEYAKTKLRLPVLWLGGASGTKDLLQRQLTPVSENLQGEVMQQCGHWLATECPTKLAQRLLNFFSESN